MAARLARGLVSLAAALGYEKSVIFLCVLAFLSFLAFYLFCIENYAFHTFFLNASL